MNCNDVKPYLKVRIAKLGTTDGMMIVPRHLECREIGIKGTVVGHVPGHGGDVWFVKHDESQHTGAYCYDEMEPVEPIAWDVTKSCSYAAIKGFYAEKKAQRSGVPYINHIDEGIVVLKAIGATPNAMMAFCLHPFVQDDVNLEHSMDLDSVHRNWLVHGVANDGISVIILAMEYRRTANSYLSFDELQSLTMSPLPEVKQMLIADKVQNRKDFEIYHKQTHPRAQELDNYFKTWLTLLSIDELEYERLCYLIEEWKKTKPVLNE